MEDKNKSSKSNQYKFTSNLLNRPFSLMNEVDQKDQGIKEEIMIEDNLTNNDKANDDGMDLSTSSIHKMEASGSKNSLSGSISFTKKELNSQFNIPNQTEPFNEQLNNIMNQSTTSFNHSQSSNKRKPFDKVSFRSDAITQLTDKNQIPQITPSASQILLNSKTNMNIQEEKSFLSENHPMNTSVSFQEKSQILSSFKTLSKETLEKAKLFNSQYKNSMPFWIKFFDDIESDSLQSNSSYYKVANKGQYVNSLIEMVQSDAKLYDKMLKNKVVKEQTQKSIKDFLQEDNLNTGINTTGNKKDKNKNTNKSQLQDKEKDTTTALNESSTKPPSELDKSQLEINSKLAKVLCVYDKIDEKDKKYYTNDSNYDTFKFNLITGGKFTNTTIAHANKPETNLNMIKEVQNEMAHIDDEGEMTAEEKNIIFGKQSKTIDTLYFGPDYTYEELNYDKIDFGCYEKSSIKRLLELDRKLHEIDPKRYNTSINTELKKIQDDFNATKLKRHAKAEKEARELFQKYKLATKETKPSIFDIKEKNEDKIVYKDYLREFRNQNKYKKEMEDKMGVLDNKIKQIYSDPIAEEKKAKIDYELEVYHDSEEYKELFNNMILPGQAHLNHVTREMENFDKNNKQIISDLETLKMMVKEDQKNKLQDKDEEKYQNEVVKPFYEFQDQLDKEQKDNKALAEKISNIEEANLKEEQRLNELNEQLNKLHKNRDQYEKMFEDADKVMNENNDDEKTEQIEGINGKSIKDYYKLYGIDELKEENDLIKEENLKQEMENVYQMFLETKEKDEQKEDKYQKRRQELLKIQEELNTHHNVPTFHYDNKSNELNDSLDNNNNANTNKDNQNKLIDSLDAYN